MSSFRFADSVDDPCCSLVKYSDGRDKETGQSKLHGQILTKFWKPSVCLSLSLPPPPPLSLSLTRTHTHTHTHTHKHTHAHAKTHDHFPSNKIYNHLNAVFIGCTVCFNTERLFILYTSHRVWMFLSTDSYVSFLHSIGIKRCPGPHSAFGR